jgi:hypothetical protein
MAKRKSHLPDFYLNTAISLVWLINGLFCKLLGLVPRHEQIVARILGEAHAGVFTKVIGVLEVLIAVWVFTRKNFRQAAILQAIVIASMNLIEFFVVPDLLLYGRMNIVFAGALILLVLINGKFNNRKSLEHA